MVDITQITPERAGPEQQTPLILGRALTLLWPVADALIVVALSVLAGAAYHLVVYGEVGQLLDFAKVGAAVALFRWILQQPLSAISQRPQRSLRYQFYLWNAAFLCLLAFGFLGKISDSYSRGTIVLFYVSGLPLLIMWQEVWKRFVRQGLSSGRLAVRRGLLLGTMAKVDEFRSKYRPGQSGMVVSDVVILPDEGLGETPNAEAVLNQALSRTIDMVRRASVNDVVILLPWSATHAINACVDKLMTIPASVQLGPEAIFDRLGQVHLSRLGPATMLNLIRPPLTRIEVLAKRLFDFWGALALLIAISPLLLVAAILIKLDSPGPIFFRQQRLGFNQRPFRILKFRTMTVTEDGDAVTQAVKDDPRVTKIGKHLRRWNIDELPQLVNVLTGDMSLVGPRPHAVTHDRDFEQRVAFYARRHNIKPGITGWAQVNGHRGPTDTEEKMQARVEHDFYYIDNWSIPLDLYILALTALSPKAFRNAH
ncbi:MAG TPA: exopolysaccharide biosynthesis polyprenyl glycosylphosphotransferase [Phycisphaerae bacterium]|nr:exopolysaccharide biosynthesis polyprenyl glycosylphosphotransferase [Phycisphaerae bacterium]